jgi:hypothetical protein
MSGRMAAQTVQEHEPNDDARSATMARMGDTIAGIINPDDVDYFAVDLEAGDALELIAAHVPFCRDFSLLDASGNRLAFGNCMDNVDTLRFTIPANGRYLIRVTQFDDAPGDRPSRPYSMHIGTNPASIGLSHVIDMLLANERVGLDSAELQQIDGQGNRNGVLDVGDVRAYLRATGILRGGKWN